MLLSFHMPIQLIFFYVGLFFLLKPSQWRDLSQLMIIGYLCGGSGLHYIMMQLMIHQTVNTAHMRLMLSNDVETNPGPVRLKSYMNLILKILYIDFKSLFLKTMLSSLLTLIIDFVNSK